MDKRSVIRFPLLFQRVNDVMHKKLLENQVSKFAICAAPHQLEGGGGWSHTFVPLRCAASQIKEQRRKLARRKAPMLGAPIVQHHRLWEGSVEHKLRADGEEPNKALPSRASGPISAKLW
jgi:hypothetical protein